MNRRGIDVHRTAPGEPGANPHHRNVISTQVRMYWPPKASRDAVREVFKKACDDAWAEYLVQQRDDAGSGQVLVTWIVFALLAAIFTIGICVSIIEAGGGAR